MIDMQAITKIAREGMTQGQIARTLTRDAADALEHKYERLRWPDGEWPTTIQEALEAADTAQAVANAASRLAAELHTLAEVLGEQEDR